MGKIISFANNKGGVGKTTTCLNIGQAWAKMGKKVLLVDLDSQANLTGLVSTLTPDERDSAIMDWLVEPGLCIPEKISENLHLIPSDLTLSNFERKTAHLTGREYLLEDLLQTVRDKYDLILVDCPPALSIITYNALIASDYLVLITTPDSLGYQGISMLLGVYAEVVSSKRLNTNLKIGGVIITKYERERVSNTFVAKAKKDFGAQLIEPPIRKAAKMQQAVALRSNIFDYDPNGKATQDYYDVATTLALRILTD